MGALDNASAVIKFLPEIYDIVNKNTSGEF